MYLQFNFFHFVQHNIRYRNGMCKFFGSLFLLLIAGCSTIQAPQIMDVNQQQHQQALEQLTRWKIQGKIAIKTPKENFSANLHWSQQQDSYHIRLTNLIGSTLLEMEGNNTFSELTFDGQDFFDTDPERLLERITGWQLPVKAFPQLIKGFVPNDDFELQISKQGLPEQITQTNGKNQGWKIQYRSYQQVKQFWLPENVKLDKQPNNIRIRISKWTLI